MGKITPEQKHEMEKAGWYYDSQYDCVRTPRGGSYVFEPKTHRRLTIDEQWEHAYEGYIWWQAHPQEHSKRL